MSTVFLAFIGRICYTTGMTSDEYKATLAQLALSRRKWAKMIDATPRAVQNRADGTSGVSGLEAKFLRLLALRPELVKIVEDME